MSAPTPFLIRSTTLAAQLEVAPGTLRNWRSKGLGPRPTRLSPNDVRYAPADVEAWLAAVKKSGSVRAVPFAVGGDV